jgi:hypothetical protein
MDRSLHLLAAAYPLCDPEILAQLSIGDRDSRLFLLRKWLFGSQMVNVSNCPQCTASVEWEMSTDYFLPKEVREPAAPREYKLKVGHYELRYRLPNSDDISNVLKNKVYQDRPDKVLKDCVLDLKYRGKDFTKTKFPESVLKRLDVQIGRDDPHANISILLNCGVCSHQWEIHFDILGYLWAELDNWAKHLLQDIFTLARAFKWSEKDILEMSSLRRRTYLQMLAS